MSSEHKILARIPISVRWRDMDSMGHVNNAKYISYLEEARVRWMLGVDGVSMTDRIAPVVAAVTASDAYRVGVGFTPFGQRAQRRGVHLARDRQGHRFED